MNLRRKKRAGFNDSSASSDIAFLLIIYFIVIAGFNINKGFLLNLPARDSSRMVQRENLLRFELDGAGNVIAEGRPVSPQEAWQSISGGISRNPNLAVMLQVSPDTPWQYVVYFVEMAQSLRVEAFSFSMKNEGIVP